MNNSSDIELSIIIVNWNSKDWIRKCIKSIEDDSTTPNLEIIIVDSGSFDGCDQMLNTKFPNVHFYQSQENIGFSASNNLGFQKSKGRFILFLNPDTELTRGVISTLIMAAKTLKNPGIIGATLLNTDLSIQDTSIQSFPNILNQLLDSCFLRKKFPNSKLWKTKALYSDDIKPQAVDTISGACMLLHRSLVEQLSGFSENYFMYSEDVDLSYRSHLLGRQNYLIKESKIVHHGGGSAHQRKSDFSNIKMRESRFIYFLTHKGKLYAYLYRVLLTVSAAIRIVLNAIPAIRDKQNLKSEKKSYSRHKWVSILTWCLGLPPKN